MNDLKTVVRHLLGHENDGQARAHPLDFVVAITHNHPDHIGENGRMSDRTIYYTADGTALVPISVAVCARRVRVFRPAQCERSPGVIQINNLIGARPPAADIVPWPEQRPGYVHMLPRFLAG